LTNKNATPRQHDDYFLSWILKIAAAVTVELSKESQLVYLERLRQLSADEIRQAATLTIEDWALPCQMPPLPFILARAARQPGDEAPAILARDDKPPDWIELGRKNGVTKEEIAQWLEEGKRNRLEHYAKLEADPKWRATAERLGAKPSLGASVDQLAAARNGATTIPADPVEREPWAHRKAVKQGWLDDAH